MANGNTIGRLTYQPYPQGDSNSHIQRIPPSNKPKLTPAEQASIRADLDAEIQRRLANGPTLGSIAGDITREYGHDALDLGAMIPVVGPAFDAANGAWYAAEGDAVNSGLSFGSAISGVATGGLGSSAFKAVTKSAKAIAKVAKAANRGAKAAKGISKATRSGKKKGNGGGDTGQPNFSDPCKTGKGVGNPVNPILGIKGLYDDNDLDFSFPAVVPLNWQRCYFSDVGHLGFLGQGWLLAIDVQIRQEANFLVYYDEQGRRIYFPLLDKDDDTFFNCYDSLEMTRKSESQLSIKNRLNGHVSTFSLSEDNNFFSLITLEDRFGNKLSIARNADGSASELIDSSGRCFTILYTEIRSNEGDRVKRIEKVKCRFSSFSDQIETLVSYSYDQHGNLSSVFDSSGKNVRQFFYKGNILTKHILYDGYECCYEYDKLSQSGRVIKHTTNHGEVWHFKYTKNKTKVTDGAGNVSVYKYDDSYNLLEYIDANNNKSYHKYDKWNREIEFTDADNNRTQYHYDVTGNIILTVFPDGHIEKVEFDPDSNLPATFVSPCGGRFDYKYDLAIGQCKIFKPSGKFITYLFDKRGRLSSKTDYLGNEIKYSYDFLGNLCSITDCSGNITEFKTDKFGYIAEIKSPDGNFLQYVHDPMGRILRITYPDSSYETFDYNTFGKLIKHTNKGKNTTYLNYDNFGLIKSIKYPNGDEYAFCYNAFRKLASIKNPDNKTYLFLWDANDNLIFEQAFDGIKREYKYSASGREQEIIESGIPGVEDLRGCLHSRFSYNKSGLITSVDNWFDNTPEHSVQKYYYDAIGRLINAVTQDNVSTSFLYDPDGLLYQETTQTASHNFTIKYEYDANENVICLLTPDGNALRNQYYGSGHLIATTYDNKSVCEFERDSLHRETARTQGSLTSRLEYDSMNRVLSYTSSNHRPDIATGFFEKIFSWNYKWGVNGTLDTLYEDYVTSTKKTTFHYDSVDRLIGRNHEWFVFDRIGTICGEDLINRPPPPVNSDNIKYDSLGNVIFKKSLKSYELKWNAFHQLVESTTDSNNEKIVTQYGYDALGRRLWKKNTNTESTTFFIWDRERLLCEQNDHLKYTYIYGDEYFKPIAKVEEKIDSDSKVEPKILWFHTDPVGLPILLTDKQGDVVWSGKYSAWGKLKGADPDIRSNTRISESHQPLRYPGQYADDETGLSYNRYRYYDPELAQYISQDPIRLAAGLNLYHYVANPLISYDPLGLIGVNVTPGAGGSFDLSLSRQAYPETAGHIESAIRQGHPSSVTIDRSGAKSNRAKSLAPIRRDIRNGVCPKPAKGQDLDEWPMAMFKEGGTGASVRPISAGDNRGAGSSIAHSLRGLPDGSRVNFSII